jgi:SAM-dependent methyltransferase
MPQLPDLFDPRYLDEVGYFLYQEEHSLETFGHPYDEERRAWSKKWLGQILEFTGLDEAWLEDRTVVAIGSGCTGDLATWPARTKIAVDPLLHTYQALGMLLEDSPGTSPTIYLSVSAEDIPLNDGAADLILCRNALDHMHRPDVALEEMWRIVADDGRLFFSVDIGGDPTPDEPTVFSEESLREAVSVRFDIERVAQDRPHSANRELSVRMAATRKPDPRRTLDKRALLEAYTERNMRRRS